RRGAICRSGRAQAKLALCLLACLSHLVEVVPCLRAQAVLASQGRYQVDVIRSVPDRHPAHPEVIALRGEPSPAHDPHGDLRPLCVRQQPVPRRGPQRTVPDRLRVVGAVERGKRLGEQAGQAAQVAGAVRAAAGFEFVRITESGNQVRIGVFVRLARAVQIVQQPGGTRNTFNLRLHRCKIAVWRELGSRCCGMTAYFVLALALFMDMCAGRVMRRLAGTLAWAVQGITVTIPSEEALSAARARLGAGPLRLLFEKTAGLLAPV